MGNGEGKKGREKENEEEGRPTAGIILAVALFFRVFTQGWLREGRKTFL
jgi:hypothetical protein